MAQLAQIAQPDMAYITNIHESHLDGLKNLQTIAREKSTLYHQLSQSGVAFINDYDAHAQTCLDASQHCQQIRIGCNGHELMKDSIVLDELGQASFISTIRGQRLPISLNIPGRHQAINAHATAVIADYLGLAHVQIAKALSQVNLEKHRTKVHSDPVTGAAIIDDTYNAIPCAVHAAIACLASQKQSQKILVICDMEELGDEAVAWHKKVGEWASTYGVSHMITTGPLCEHSRAAFSGSAESVEELELIAPRLRSLLHADSVVLIKGSRKGGLERVVEAMLNTHNASGANT